MKFYLIKVWRIFLRYIERVFLFLLKFFAQDHADRVLEAMNSEALEERLQVEFVSK